jgi:hypothetical protein
MEGHVENAEQPAGATEKERAEGPALEGDIDKMYKNSIKRYYTPPLTMSTADRMNFLECVNEGLKTITEDPKNTGAIINVIKKHTVIWSMIEESLKEQVSDNTQARRIGDITLDLAGNMMTGLMGACIQEGTPEEEIFEFIATVKSMSKEEKRQYLEQPI